MDIGLALPQYDFSVPGESPLRWETVVAWAQRAEALGFSSLWVSDHLFLDIARFGGGPGFHGCHDPLVALAALARCTTRVRLGTLTLCTPLRPATLTAKALATVDVVSGGRVIAGLGAGWYEPELEEVGRGHEPPGVRLSRLAEAVQVVKGMFTGGPFSFQGRHESAVEARCLPRPVQQPHPPVWVGGRGDRLLDLVARHADGWNTAWRHSPEQWAERSSALDRACERAGRDPAAVARSAGVYALVGEDHADVGRRFERLARAAPPGVLDGVPLDRWRQDRLVGTVEEVGAQLERWRALGVGTLIVSVGPLPFSVADADDLETLAMACRL